jgi:hypothetical protein
MNDRDRASLAEQLLANPLFDELMGGLEKDAIEAMVYASTDEIRARAAMRVQATRSFRADCEAWLRNTRERKAPV